MHYLYMPALPLCALGHNNGFDVCASSECRVFAQALLSCQCSHMNRQVCLISWHMFQIVFLRLRARRRSDFVPEEGADLS